MLVHQRVNSMFLFFLFFPYLSWRWIFPLQGAMGGTAATVKATDPNKVNQLANLSHNPCALITVRIPSGDVNSLLLKMVI